MTKLLTEEELRIQVNTLMHFFSEAYTTEDKMQQRDRLVDLIQSQKHAHADMVVGEELLPYDTSYDSASFRSSINKRIREQRKRNKV